MSTRRVAALVVTAMPEEAQPFLESLALVDKAEPLSLLGTAQAWSLELPARAEGADHTRELILVHSGIGLVSAASALATVLSQVTPDVVVSAGTTGGLGREVEVGDVCVSQTLAYGDVDATAFGYAIGQTPGQPTVFRGDPVLVERAGAAQEALGQATPASVSARIHVAQMLAGGSFVTAANVKDMRERFPRAISTDMESTALAQVCHAAGIPFVSIRGVSDLCGPEAGQDFHIGADEAATRSTAVVLAALR
ncbi:5'-methylthioadenosine/S-adenosylhomocysteine nucleosidase [Actinomyces faecalis]|uniref:5'-methylthioadenosine/S-adenosylhomocysteine nucleosidase n=1 Tax=Actinomyces faecalis TaxID=2722820 RepID=UPI0015580496|nr:5'-methylthioadenosine/S-adenosylhomocysteine nucleosidase [Actinomyces faecalis]